MYENNYNYIDVPEEKTKSKSSVGKTVALLMAVAVVGGASGFGGAFLESKYLENNLAAESSSTTVVSGTSPAVKAETTAVSDSENKVSSLLASSSSDGVLSTKQIVEKASPSVVSVHAQYEDQLGTGTGIILSSDGYIITNAHVVQTQITERSSGSNNNSYSFGNGFNGYGDYSDFFNYFFGGSNNNSSSYEIKTVNCDKVTVVLSDDEETEYEAEIIGADENSDLAVLKIDTQGVELTAAEIGDSNILTMGDKAVAIGYPMGLGLSTSEGIVSGLNRTINVELSSGGSADMTLIQTDAAINPGNSGGPLLNCYGQVIGITSSKLVDSDVEGLGFAIPITDAMPIISDLMNKGYVVNRTPQIGITATDVTSAFARYYNLPVNEGVMVESVAEGGAAEAAGISEGDVIVAADGKAITSMQELTAAKNGKQIGDEMVLTLARADGNIDVTIVLKGEEDSQ